MNWLTTLGLLIVGLVVLTIGAELLVRGAATFAASVGVSPLVIGLTIVAFGTSAPELVVSFNASLLGDSEIAMGNAIGSNIVNILLILGVCAAIAPLQVAQQLVRLDVPIMIGVSILLYVMSLDGNISFLDGLVLFAGIIFYTVWGIRQSRKESAEINKEYEGEFALSAEDRKNINRIRLINLGYIIAGLFFLVLGANWLVNAAITIAESLGVSKTIVGLTIVAAGTSLPELATSVMATIRGNRDIAIGNVVGSSIFNILSVLGLSAMVGGKGLTVTPQMEHVDMVVMIGVALACLPIFFKGVIARWEGGLFLACYVLYTVYLIFLATESPQLPAFSQLNWQFILPLITIIVLGTGWQALQTTYYKK